tara:strand:+ start:1460 stop:2200 length:741 start_codon:yes stop_codon:yes gene_type:complete
MSSINKNFIFPVPTAWKGQDQDDANVGIDTYVGPKDILCRFMLDNNGNKTTEFETSFDKDDFDAGTVPHCPINQYEVILDADEYPLHAAALGPGKPDGTDSISPPHHIEVVAGPSSDPNPRIQDPHHMHEVYDMRSFYWDPALNSNAGGWSTPKFATAAPSPEEDDDNSFGWDNVREVRNRMLDSSDSRIAEDAPDSFKQQWKDYRTKLRNLPQDWVGVGSATHLIVWPMDPDETANPLHVQRDGD